MNCERILELCVGDDELDASSQQELRAHVAHCSSCNRVVTGYRQTATLCASAMDFMPPPELTDNLKRYLRQATGS